MSPEPADHPRHAPSTVGCGTGSPATTPVEPDPTGGRTDAGDDAEVPA